MPTKSTLKTRLRNTRLRRAPLKIVKFKRKPAPTLHDALTRLAVYNDYPQVGTSLRIKL